MPRPESALRVSLGSRSTLRAPGVYQTDEGVFIVKPTKDRQRVYAKRLVEITGDRLTASGERKRIEYRV
jgi:hypothetical protein